jgi:hypothetical protein
VDDHRVGAWLADAVDPSNGREAFHTYVRQSSVLLAPREAGVNSVSRSLPWMLACGGTDGRSCRLARGARGHPRREISPLALLPDNHLSNLPRRTL